MKQLKHIPIDNLIDWYDTILENKKDLAAQQELTDIQPQVNLRYEHYKENFSSYNIINISDSGFERNHIHLLSCFKSSGNILSRLKKVIRDSQDDGLKGICQYCGVNRPKTMDHYLPISDYPEYSVLGINLIPCCQDCNKKKHSYWKEGEGRGIINFYLDNIPEEQFLFGKVHFIYGIPSVKFELKNIDNCINSVFYEILKKHFIRLELIPLYNDVSTDELGEIIRIFSIYISNSTPKLLKNNLIKDAQQLQLQFGINYWKAILRITLSNSDEFINFMIQKIQKG